MIPKTIHLCWLSGDPYPKKIQFCIDSWKKYLPDFEIMLWDTKRFDVNSLTWTRQAFEAKKYAFVADYIRLYAVYNYGGIYFDSDVEVIRPFDDLLDLPYFLGSEVERDRPEMAAFGAEKGTAWLKDAMERFTDRVFVKENGEWDIGDIPTVVGKMLHEKYEWTPIENLSEFDPDPSKICVLPVEWFNAHPRVDAHTLKYEITPNTRSIHHFANSWTDWEYVGGPLQKLYYKITGKDWLLGDNRFKLYGAKKNKR